MISLRLLLRHPPTCGLRVLGGQPSTKSCLDDGHGAVVVAVSAVRVVQVAIDQVVHVVAVRNGFVAAALSMNMALVVPRALVRWRALIGVLLAHRDLVLIDVITVGMMQVPVVQVVDVPIVFDLELVGELDGGTTLAGGRAFKENSIPLEAYLGGRYGRDGGLYATAGVGVGLFDAPGVPSLRVFGGLGWASPVEAKPPAEEEPAETEPEEEEPEAAPEPPPEPEDPDKDRDGKLNEDDMCPSDPEDYDGCASAQMHRRARCNSVRWILEMHHGAGA